MNNEVTGIELLEIMKGKQLLLFPALKLKGVVGDKYLNKHLIRYAYIPGYITHALATVKRLKGNPKKFIAIHSKDIKAALTTRHYGKVIRDLEDGGVIERNGYYKPGEVTIGYRFTRKYRYSTSWMAFIIPKKKQKEWNNEPEDKSLQYLSQQLERITLNPLSVEFIKYIYAHYNRCAATIIQREKNLFLINLDSRGVAKDRGPLFFSSSSRSCSFTHLNIPISLFNHNSVYTYTSIGAYNTIQSIAPNISVNNSIYSVSFSLSIYLHHYVFTVFEQLRKEMEPRLKAKSRNGNRPLYKHLQFIYDLINLSNIHSGGHCRVFRDTTSNRVHTSITSLRAILRYFMRVRGCNDDLVSIDLANSQVFLVNLYLKEAGVDFELPDVKHFLAVTSEGSFYEFIRKEANLKTKEEVKAKFFKGYFFNENGKGDPTFHKIMQIHFPTIHQFVWNEKKGDYNSFAIKLQRAESTFFIDCILPRLISESPIGSFNTTLHDSIVTNRSNVQLVDNIIKTEFQKIGFVPMLKHERYSLMAKGEHL